MDYEHIFKRAASIAWKYKILWVFGFLAGCGANRGSANFSWNQSFSNSGGGFTDPNGVPGDLPPEMQRLLLEIGRLVEQNAEALMGGLFAIFCLSIIVGLVYFVVRNYGYAGLTTATANIERNGLESVNFSTISKLGSPYVLRLLGFDILLGLPGFVLGAVAFFVVVGAAVASDGDVEAVMSILLLLVCCLGCIGFFITLAIRIVGSVAKTALVIDDLTILDSLRRGWTVLKENIGGYVILWLMLLALSLLINMVMVIPALIVAAPAMTMFFTQGPELFLENIGRNLFTILGLSLLMWPIVSILRGIITTFTTNIWTIAYLEASGDEPMLASPAPDAEFPDLAPQLEGN